MESLERQKKQIREIEKNTKNFSRIASRLKNFQPSTINVTKIYHENRLGILGIQGRNIKIQWDATTPSDKNMTLKQEIFAWTECEQGPYDDDYFPIGLRESTHLTIDAASKYLKTIIPDVNINVIESNGKPLQNFDTVVESARKSGFSPRINLSALTSQI